LLFDKEFNLKLADFGYSSFLGKNKKSGKLKSYLGTEIYMAPEIHLNIPYNGTAVDLFAAGIILFIMKAGTPAFGYAFPKDDYYKLLCTNKHKEFWNEHENQRG
jgi:serine/threonine protein kinase